MTPINTAMARSLHHRSVLDVLAASLYPVLSRRDISGSIDDVKTAFSSWDNCMQVAYCKWPVIALIIIGGLILLSVVWCIARCACCGLSCCCECCYCLKCCGDCCGCCTPPRKAHKYLDDPENRGQEQQHSGFHNTQAYHSEAPMMTGAAPMAKSPMDDDSPPQFATFDVSKKGPVDEDALPAMPSWESSSHTKVLVEEGAVELTDMKKPIQTTPSPTAMGPGAGFRGITPAPQYGSYGAPMANNVGGNPAVSNGYMAAGALSPSDQGYSQGYNQGYDQNGQTWGNNNMNVPSRQYSTSEYSTTGGGYGGQTGERQILPAHLPAYGGRTPVPQQQQQQQQAYGERNITGGRYDSMRPNGTPSPGPQGNDADLDRRTPHIPDLSMRPVSPVSPVHATSPGSQGGYESNLDRRTPRIPELGMSNVPSSGGYNDYRSNGSPSPGSQPFSNDLDRRTPRIPELGPSGATSRSTPIGLPQSVRPAQRSAYEMPGSATEPISSRGNTGFNFGSNYSRPQELDSYDNGRSRGHDRGNGRGSINTYAYTNTASPPPLAQPQPRQMAYPGYREYQQ